MKLKQMQGETKEIYSKCEKEDKNLLILLNNVGLVDDI